jgi:hypothetical protein
MACSILLTEVQSLLLHCSASHGCSSPGSARTVSVVETAVTLPFAPLQNDEFLRLVINSIRNDITGRNEPFQCLALNFIGSGERRSCSHACHALQLQRKLKVLISSFMLTSCRLKVCGGLLLQLAARRWLVC